MITWSEWITPLESRYWHIIVRLQPQRLQTQTQTPRLRLRLLVATGHRSSQRKIRRLQLPDSQSSHLAETRCRPSTMLRSLRRVLAAMPLLSRQSINDTAHGGRTNHRSVRLINVAQYSRMRVALALSAEITDHFSNCHQLRILGRLDILHPSVRQARYQS